jgi:hypothetical protein
LQLREERENRTWHGTSWERILIGGSSFPDF